MFQQVTPRSSFWLGTLYAMLIFGIIGCGGDDDDNEWIGTWAIERIDGESIEQTFAEGEELGIDFSIVPNSWTFNDDGTMDAEFGIEFETKEEGFTISGSGGMRITGTYSLSGSRYTLTPTTVKGTGILEGAPPPIAATEDTGTWSREGNTLTLTNDDSSTIVFKKK